MSESTYDFLANSPSRVDTSQPCEAEPRVFSSLVRPPSIEELDSETEDTSDEQQDKKNQSTVPQPPKPPPQAGGTNTASEATQSRHRALSAAERDFHSSSDLCRRDTLSSSSFGARALNGDGAPREASKPQSSSFGARLLSGTGKDKSKARGTGGNPNNSGKWIGDGWLSNPFELGGAFYPVLEMVPWNLPKMEADEPTFIHKGLFLGSYYSVQQKARLQKLKVWSILTVACGLPPKFPYQFKYTIINVWDTPDTNLKQHFERCFSAIDEGRSNGGVVVHCAAGVSRSATVVIAYLMRTKRVSLATAIAHVKRRRHIIHPNSGFMEQLKQYECELFKTG